MPAGALPKALRLRPTPPSSCEHHVNKVPSNRVLGTLLPALLLAGCGTPPAKDFGGHWKPVNRFQAATTEIPLNRPYTYYASPTDETLRAMLVRWTTDTGMTLVYHLPSDFTLFEPVTKVRTVDVRQAAQELSSVYAAQGVRVTVEGNKLRVGRAGSVGPDTAPSHPPESPPLHSTEKSDTTGRAR
ncbi:Toxin co-regulated pilus biosynthesis protein Q [Frateuria terrea]|uniref:Toxin co-regulated pilus biosynthesis protein Q n=1 Tax=Frateuria terrea TaxID=529704 RepID=A0A1H6TUX5_9GAMM|nr:Toxin co-regulated pilus biosynthesis protein Q [Frateuria terrea]SFP40098.1 Toxin co-regulated pilus biosynthesis protein Q [Frateuria terrea]